MAATESPGYRGPRPVAHEKPDCRFHQSTIATQEIYGAPQGDRFMQAPADCNFDNQMIRSKGAGTCNPYDAQPAPATPGGMPSSAYSTRPVNPAMLPAAGKRVQHNNVVRPGILDKGHSAKLDSESRTWVNHPDFMEQPPPLDMDGAPQVREQDQGFDTWGWAVESTEERTAPSPTRGHEGYGPAPPGAEVKWRSSVSMAGVRMKREEHGSVHHVPSALERRVEAAPSRETVIPPWATEINP